MFSGFGFFFGVESLGLRASWAGFRGVAVKDFEFSGSVLRFPKALVSGLGFCGLGFRV